MKIFRFILPAMVLIASSCFSQPAPTILSVSLKPSGSIPFNFFDVYGQQLHFKNNTNKDTVITKKVLIDKPKFLYYGNFLVLPKGPVFLTYPVLLIPGDTILLKQGEDNAIVVQRSSGYPNFIDSLISIPEDFYLHNLEQQQTLLKTVGLAGMIQQIENSFRKNEVSICNLNLPDMQAEILRKMNSSIKYTATAHLLVDPTVSISSTTDSLYNDMYRHVNEIRSLNALNNTNIYRAIIAYNAKKRNRKLDYNDVWACVAGADEQVKQTDFYKDYITTMVAEGFVYAPEKIQEINQALKGIRMQDPYLDTMYQLTNILSETVTDFKRAKQQLKSFANGRYSYIIENDENSANHEKKSITHLAAVDLYNFAGNQSDFKQIITNTNYKLTLIDFWASWCIPCINEMPALKKVENKLKDKPIQFVAISIDKEEDVGKWIDAAKRNKIFHKPSQYRLANFKQSPLTKLINLKNIPRYLVIDNKGNILDDDFYRPSDDRFELALLKYLN
ncbi:TlpA disulfide reductase family protein [Olivibacter sp. CPCC 100613]|uniref:TlpA family protein disulfide reductase n=1 Tax=Olivibacter sp. CPCC 100613 TaxID=3079931 RepID=UPI002FF79D59